MITELPTGIVVLTEQEALEQGYVSTEITMVGGLVYGDSIRWRTVLGAELFGEFLQVRNVVVQQHGSDFSCGKAIKLVHFNKERFCYIPADLEMKIAGELETFLTTRGVKSRW